MITNIRIVQARSKDRPISLKIQGTTLARQETGQSYKIKKTSKALQLQPASNISIIYLSESDFVTVSGSSKASAIEKAKERLRQASANGPDYTMPCLSNRFFS